MQESGRIRRSADEWDMSRSPHSATFSSAVTECPRIRRASPQMRSLSSGLRLWGMDDEPVCPSENGSSSSRISVRWSPRISVANFSSDAAMIASVVTNAACLSRCTTWLETGATAMPSSSQTRASTLGGTVACVPTGPEILPTAMSARAARRRARLRRISSHQRASLSPSVTGSAWTPCVLPIISVPLCSRARLARASMQRFISSSSASAAATI